MNTKQIGNLTELQCVTRLYELGCKISISYGGFKTTLRTVKERKNW